MGLNDDEFSSSRAQNTPEFMKTIPLLTSILTFLHKTLPPQVFLLVFRQFSLDLQAHLWEWIVTAHRFSTLGGILFSRDMYALWDACSQFVPSPELYMKRLHEAVILLSLPSNVGSAPIEEGITLATVTEQLRQTNETDVEKATELKNWLAENLKVDTLSLPEVLYM